jgi:hypothetical protein
MKIYFAARCNDLYDEPLLIKCFGLCLVVFTRSFEDENKGRTDREELCIMLLLSAVRAKTALDFISVPLTLSHTIRNECGPHERRGGGGGANKELNPSSSTRRVQAVYKVH